MFSKLRRLGAFLFFMLILCVNCFAIRKASITIGTEFHVYSKALGEHRTYSVSLPLSYVKSKAKYPVVFILDGEYYFTTAVGACRFMSFNEIMPEAIVVGINNTDRRRDMTPPDITLPDVEKSNGDAFLTFLEMELLPVLEARYRILPLRVLVGHSHGGLIGAYAISAKPELFRWYVLIDPPMQLGERVSEKRLASFFSAHHEQRGRMISIEHSFGWRDDAWRELEGAVPRGYTISRIKMKDETHPAMYYQALYVGLKWLYSDMMARQDSLVTLTDVKSRYANLSDACGYDIPIPQQALMMDAEDQLMAGRPHEASEFVSEAERRFGADTETKNFRAWAAELEQHPLDETYDKILASQKPTPEQMRKFLGSWEGISNTMSPNRVVISFAAEGERVVARQQEFDKAGNEVTPVLGEIAYIRMRGADSLEWGYMNGMRPRTMIISFTGSIDSKGALTGRRGFKAVSFAPDRTDSPGRRERFEFIRKK